MSASPAPDAASGDDQELSTVAYQLLADGPMAMADLVRWFDDHELLDDLRAEGLEGDDLDIQLLDEVLLTDDLWHTPGDVLVRADHLLDGSIFTHRLTEGEIERGEVAVIPDLAVLDWAADDDLRLPDGSDLDCHFGSHRPGHDDTAFAGPDGWLDRFSPGDVIGFRRIGTTVEIDPAGELSDDQVEVDRLRAALDGRVPPGTSEETPPIVLDALTASVVDGGPAWRRPVRPLGELLEAAGGERRGFSWGRRGEEWMSAFEQFAEDLIDRLADDWDFDPCCIEAFDAVVEAFDRFGAGQDFDARASAGHLGHGAVAPAFAAFGLATTGGLGDLRGFADLLVAASPARLSAPARTLQAVAAERDRDVEGAESILRRALRDDPSYGPAAFTLAGYALDRGDIDRAVMLFRHPGLMEGDPTLAYLEELQQARRRVAQGVGRNDPCPCGSGRKFKVCCQSNRGAPLAERTALLTHKLLRFSAWDEHRSTVDLLARLAEITRGGDGSPESVETLGDDPVIMDIALWEGGIAADYLDTRGVLLPGDERELLDRLIAEPRRLWEVTGAEPGANLTLRDTATGETVVVDEKLGSVNTEVGDYGLARVVPVGSVNQMIGTVIKVPLRARESAIQLVDADPTAYLIAEWYGECHRPPRFTNREGEPLALCLATLSTRQELGSIRRALDSVLESDREDSWTEMVTLPDGDRVVRGSVRAEPGTLTIEANSDIRMDRLLELVTGILPYAELEADERLTGAALFRALAEVKAPEAIDAVRPGGDGRLEGGPDGAAADALPDGAAEMLEEFIRHKERGWIDESVPALGGLTPRQAADDPTRREDLIRLLHSFDNRSGATGGGGYDPDRLRALLGIPGSN
jgi:hypothetical protein